MTKTIRFDVDRCEEGIDEGKGSRRLPCHEENHEHGQALGGKINIMNSSLLRLSIVVPKFNESRNVRELLCRLEATLGAIGWEVIFVDDDSPDGTATEVRDIARADPWVRCLQRVGRRGLSSACIEGMLATSAPIIAVMDADLQHDETVLPRMLAEIEQGGADLVVGTRYSAGGSTGDWNKSRRAMSQLATMTSRAILKQPVSDPMSGFFMLQRKVLDFTVRGPQA